MDQCDMQDFKIKQIIDRVLEKENYKNKITGGINFYDSCDNSSHYVMDLRTQIMLRVSLCKFNRKKDEMKSQIFKFKIHKVYLDCYEYVILVIKREVKIPNCNNNKNLGKWNSQSIFDSFSDGLKGIKNSINFASATIKNVKGMFSHNGYILFLELVNMILNIREGYFTPTKIVSVVISIYTMYTRAKQTFTPQSLPDFTFDIASVIFSIIGLPHDVVKIIKDYAALTGKRLFSSNTILTVILSVYQLFKYFLTFITSYLSETESNVYYAGYAAYILDLAFGGIVCYDKIKRVTDMNLAYSSHPEVILQPEFRENVIKLDEETKDAIFMQYVSNHENKFFKSAWDAFQNNLVKYVKNFTTSSKIEPICFVFEGAPGSGKSVLMNNFVEVLRKMNKSVYIHTIPPTDAGKDFYDDYENQDVFVMDDIGQQGKSQWRTIINFVSPVKYPLECANAAKKNTKFFNSKIILCTTNGFMKLHGFTSKDCIAEPEALFRRCHVIKVEKGTTQEFTQNLTYYKFDHLAPKPEWISKFLYHNGNITLPTKLENLNKIDALRYIRQLLGSVEKNEDANRKTVSITDNELNDIMNDRVYNPQSFSNILSFLKGLYVEWDVNTIHIFNEWIKSLLAPLKSIMESTLKYIKELITGSPYDTEVTKILKARLPEDVLGKRNVYRENYKRLSLKYHPDKYDPSVHTTLTRAEAALVFVVVAMANAHYDDQETFYFNMEAIYNDPTSHRFYEHLYEHAGPRHHEYFLATYAFSKILISGIPKLWNESSSSTKFCVVYMSVYAACMLSVVLATWFGSEPSEKTETFEKYTCSKIKENSFLPQTHIDISIAKYLKFAKISNGSDYVQTLHVIVSGDRFMTNQHISFHRGIISLYNSFEHYKNDNPVVENIEFNTIASFSSCDLQVCKLKNFHPFFPKATPLFRSRDVTPTLMLQTSLGKIDLLFHKNVFKNEYAVEYTGYNKKNYYHEIDSGLITPVQSEGLCGSFVFNTHGDIIAVHSAGDGQSGFCVIPSATIAEEIRNHMFGSHKALDLDIDIRVKPNFSGTRLVYPKGAIDVSYVNGSTKIVPSPFHISHDKEWEGLIENVKDFNEPIVVPTTIDHRGPPVILKPAEKLKEISQKSFANQGTVTFAELDFIKECIRTFMPKEKYIDVDDMECAFGDDDLARLNPDSSNGYGHPNKKAYFDFETKTISPDFLKECRDFECRVKSDDIEFKDFLTKEVFKVDELRNNEKRMTPRTIRVMPIINIFYSKKIFGNLAKFIKSTRTFNGIGYGFNPYLDMDRVYKNLRDKSLTGDLDAAKWDGTLVALIMEAIIEVMFEQYDGKYKYMESYIVKSIVRTFVLIADELYATTHGLPSGTWLTLLLNSLYNRALDALVLFRKHPKPTVKLFHDIYAEVTGDDKVFGIPKHLEKYVNLLTYKEVFESLGMKCTNGDKTEITQPSQALEKMTYLKRHFRFHPVLQRYVGPLSLNTILSIPQWIDKSSDYHSAMNGKMRACQIESYLHSPMLFRMVTKIFNDKMGYDHKLFNEEEVIGILNSPDGFTETLKLHGKFDYTQI